MELKVGYEVIDSYKRLSYKVWYAFAEFVDNSTQSFKNNEELMTEVFMKEKARLKVSIRYMNGDNGFIEVKDNSIGMNYDDLVRALTIGKKPEVQTGRSKYGLGLKTASFWFGNSWEIVTTKYDDVKEYSVKVDLNNLIQKQMQRDLLLNIHDRELTDAEKEFIKTSNDLDVTEREVDKGSHYMILKITNLNRAIQGRTASKTKQYLRSMYRYDIKEGKLILDFQEDILKWNDEELLGRIMTDDVGRKFYKEFIIDVNGKKVRGWAGLLEKGSRKDAGFSLLQSKRVIQGWPDSYRPPLLFGDQEGGSNNLINQRLFGELFLDGFDVSHTKDEILFTDDDEEVLDVQLANILADYKKAGEEYRKPITEDEDNPEVDFKGIVTNLFQGMQTPKFAAAINESDVLPAEILIESNEEHFDRVLESDLKDTYTAQIGGIKVTVIINTDSSLYDPYLIIRFRATRDEVGILINRNHPHWRTMESGETIFNFIKHCIYDGIAEWKANWLINSLDPETIKTIKDNLLRQELTIQ